MYLPTQTRTAPEPATLRIVASSVSRLRIQTERHPEITGMPQRPYATPLCTPGVFLSPRRLIYLSCALLSLYLAVPVLGQTGTVSSFQKISDTEGGFTGTLDDSDNSANPSRL